MCARLQVLIVGFGFGDDQYEHLGRHVFELRSRAHARPRRDEDSPRASLLPANGWVGRDQGDCVSDRTNIGKHLGACAECVCKLPGRVCVCLCVRVCDCNVLAKSPKCVRACVNVQALVIEIDVADGRHTLARRLGLIVFGKGAAGRWANGLNANHLSRIYHVVKRDLVCTCVRARVVWVNNVLHTADDLWVAGRCVPAIGRA